MLREWDEEIESKDLWGFSVSVIGFNRNPIGDDKLWEWGERLWWFIGTVRGLEGREHPWKLRFLGPPDLRKVSSPYFGTAVRVSSVISILSTTSAEGLQHNGISKTVFNYRCENILVGPILTTKQDVWRRRSIRFAL